MAVATTNLATNVSVVTANPKISAAARVLGITELLEMILVTSDMPFFDLFVIQRTSRDFRHTIQGSSELKERMFLEPSPTSDLSGKVVVNPLVTSRCFYPRKQKQYDNDDRDIIHFGSSRGLETGRNDIDVSLRRESKNMPPQHFSRLSPGLRNHAQSSWRRMHVTMPPLKMFTTTMRRQELLPLHALEKWDAPKPELHYRIHCNNATLGAVIDALEESYRHERVPEKAWDGYDWQRNDATFKVLKTSPKRGWVSLDGY